MALDYFEGKKVLITGHTGFKGSWLCTVLKQLGAEIYGYSLDPPTTPSLYCIANIDEFVSSEIGNVCDLEHMMNYFGKVLPDIVIHMAAQPLVKQGYDDPVTTYSTNVMGTVNILECVRAFDCVDSFLNVTTDKVYFNDESGKHYVESDRLDGFDPYSNSKSCSELVTHTYARSFFDKKLCSIYTARAGNVIGGGDFAKDRIVPDCVRSALSKSTVFVRNPNSIRPYQHVLEPIFAYLTILSQDKKSGIFCDSYNVGPRLEDCVTTGELVTLFCREWGGDLNWESFNYDGPHEANYLKLDSTYIKDQLNFTPRWGISDAIRATIDWTKSWVRGENMYDVMKGQILNYMGLE